MSYKSLNISSSSWNKLTIELNLPKLYFEIKFYKYNKVIPILKVMLMLYKTDFKFNIVIIVFVFIMQLYRIFVCNTINLTLIIE